VVEDDPMWEFKVEGAVAIMAIPQAIDDGVTGSSYLLQTFCNALMLT
jgi:hypothetical protein